MSVLVVGAHELIAVPIGVPATNVTVLLPSILLGSVLVTFAVLTGLVISIGLTDRP